MKGGQAWIEYEANRRGFAPIYFWKTFFWQMKIHPCMILRKMRWNWLLALVLVLSLSSTGCRSFLRNQAMKDFPVKTSPVDGLTPNRYQEDFLYLKKLGEEVVPLEDRYFPPEKRAAMDQEILRNLGQPGATYETFLFSVERYLGAFNNQHARVVDNPRPIHFTGLYPFRIHYVSNDLQVLDISSDYDRSLIGQKITAHPAVWIAPTGKENIPWRHGRRPPHPITARSPHQYDCQIFPEQQFAYLQFNACFDKIAILDGLSMVKPWIRPLVRTWLAVQFHRSTAFADLRGIYDPDRPVFKDYLASSIRDINRQGITNLIIDLRHNGGGETELVKQLIYHLTTGEDLRDARRFEYNPEVSAFYDPKGSREFHTWYRKKFGVDPPSKQLLPTPDQERPFFHRITDAASPFHVAPDRPVFNGKIIVLANQNTGSAASILTGLIQDNRLASIVGTTTANNPTGPTGMTPFKLPRSGIMVSLPTEYCERALPSNGEILQPDYWVENSVADLHTGRDAAFDRAQALLQIKAPTSGPLLEEEVQEVLDFLKGLKARGRQPGWSKEETGEAYLEAYSYFGPKSVTFNLRKPGNSSNYHYTVIQAAKGGAWKLQRAWRTNQKGRTIEVYGSPARLFQETRKL